MNSLMFVPCKTKFIKMILNNNVFNSRRLLFNVTFMFYIGVLQIVYYLSLLFNWILQNEFFISKVTHRSLANVNEKKNLFIILEFVYIGLRWNLK